MRRILNRVLPAVAMLAVPGVLLAAGKMAVAACCCPLCCHHCWL